MTSRFEVKPTPRGITLNYHGVVTDTFSTLSVADAYELQTELDTQIALASGLDLINVQAKAVQADDVLWHIGKVVINESECSDDEYYEDHSSRWRLVLDGGQEMLLHPMTRLWVARLIL